MRSIFKIIALVIFLFPGGIIRAQQIQQYSQYMINQFVLNPAIAGTEGFLDIYLGYRNQWTGFEGAPVTYYISAHKAVGRESKYIQKKKIRRYWHGIGVQVFRDQTGPLKRTSVLGAYAYNFPVSKETRISVGSFFGFKQLRTDSDYWKNIDDDTDALFNRSLNTGLIPDFQFGAVLYNPLYFVTLAVSPILNNDISFRNLDRNSEIFYGRYNRHVFLSSGVIFQPRSDLKITPSVMLKYVQYAPLSMDLNVKITQYDKYWYGCSFRMLEAVNVFGGLDIGKMFCVSYAYEWSITAIRKYNYGSHEIILGMKVPPPRKIVCPSKYW